MRVVAIEFDIKLIALLARKESAVVIRYVAATPLCAATQKNLERNGELAAAAGACKGGNQLDACWFTKKQGKRLKSGSVPRACKLPKQ